MRLLVVLALLLSACGQVGPLVLPEKKEVKPPPAAPAPPPAPDDTQEKKKQ